MRFFFPYLDEIIGDKTRWELLEDVVCCFEQILEVAPQKTVAVWPFTFHLKNYSSKIRCAGYW